MKLHLGCGKRYLPGYLHIDLSDYPHVEFKHDVRHLPMIEDQSVSVIYASHVLEYFDDQEAIEVLREWRRKLRPGGILRLAVPNFAVLAAVYQKYNDVRLISGPIYGHWKISDDSTGWHKALYDKAKLIDLLYEVGFRTIHEWDWRKVFVNELAGFDDYSQAYIPHMDKENGVLISLNLEGVK